MSPSIAPITWPPSLPQLFQDDGYKETDKDLVISFKTDVGPPMTRMRGHSNILPFSGTMLMTTAQKATLRAFWEAHCASPFLFPDPDTGELISVVLTDRPEYVSYKPGWWKANLQMAKLP